MRPYACVCVIQSKNIVFLQYWVYDIIKYSAIRSAYHRDRALWGLQQTQACRRLSRGDARRMRDLLRTRRCGQLLLQNRCPHKHCPKNKVSNVCALNEQVVNEPVSHVAPGTRTPGAYTRSFAKPYPRRGTISAPRRCGQTLLIKCQWHDRGILNAPAHLICRASAHHVRVLRRTSIKQTPKNPNICAGSDVETHSRVPGKLQTVSYAVVAQ